MVKIFKEVNKTTLVFTDTPSSTQDFLIDLIKTSSYSDGVRIRKEYQKITITFYDGSEGTHEFINNLISMGYGGLDVNTIDVEGLFPIKTDNVSGIEITGTSKKFDSSVILPDAFKYSGLTIEQALMQHGDDALLDMCLTDLDSKEKSLLITIRAACKNYVLKKYVLSDEDIFSTSTSVMIDFIQKFKILLPSKINDILSRSSYATLEDFIQNADNLLLGSAYKALAKELVNKFK